MSTSVPHPISRRTAVGRRSTSHPGRRPGDQAHVEGRNIEGRKRGLVSRLRSRSIDEMLSESSESRRPGNAWVILWAFFSITIVAQTVVLSDGLVGRLRPYHLAAAVCTAAAVFLPHRWRRFTPAAAAFWSIALTWSFLMAFVSWRNSLDQQGLQQMLLVLLAVGPAMVYRYIVQTGSRGQLMVLQCSPLFGVVGLGWTIQANSHRTGITVMKGIMAVLQGNPNYITGPFYRRGLILPGNVEIVRGNLRHLVFVALAGSVWMAVYAVAAARRRGIRLPSWLTAVSVGTASVLIATSTSRSSLLILALPLVAMVGRLFVVQRTTLGGNKVIGATVIGAALVMVLASSFLEGTVIGRIFTDTASYRLRIEALGEAFASATKASLLAPAPPMAGPHNLILGTIGFYGWVAGVVSIALVLTILWGFGRNELKYLREGQAIHLAVAGLYSAAAVRAFTAGDNGLPLGALVGVMVATLVVAPSTGAGAAVEDPDVLARRARQAARAQRALRAEHSTTSARSQQATAAASVDGGQPDDVEGEQTDSPSGTPGRERRDRTVRANTREQIARSRSRSMPARLVPRQPRQATSPARRSAADRPATAARRPRPPLRPDRPSRDAPRSKKR